MVTEIRIYYEGDRALRPGFHAFLAEIRELARRRRCKFSLIDAGSGDTACRDFGIALKANPSAWNILLKDSECPDTGSLSIALCEKHRWDKAYADSIFWMVEMMESWFHADRQKLADFYKAGFNPNALAANEKVEQIPKKDLKDGLSAATKGTRKGDYSANKTAHGPQLLELIRPDLVRKAAPNCERLFATVLKRLE